MKKIKPPLNSSNYSLFFDFDNTITQKDIFDELLLYFSKDERWRKLEKEWQEGKIGSRAALSGQIKGIRISKEELDSYLCGVRPDPYFKRLLRLFAAKEIKVTVLSDNFDYILKRILGGGRNGHLKIYSNRLRIRGDRLIPAFPFSDKKCGGCAHCKKKNLLANAEKGSRIVYIGDGRSDVCPARYAHIVFAKEELLELRRKEKLASIPYKELKEVYVYFKKRLH